MLKSKLSQLNIWTGILLFSLAVISVLLIYPLYNVFITSFIDNETGDLTLRNYRTILGHRFYRVSLYNSVICGFGGMLGATLLGIPLAYFTSRFTIRGKAIVSTLAVLALVSPPFIGAYAWIMMLGANGWLRNLLSSIVGFLTLLIALFANARQVIDSDRPFVLGQPDIQGKLVQVGNKRGKQLAQSVLGDLVLVLGQDIIGNFLCYCTVFHLQFPHLIGVGSRP